MQHRHRHSHRPPRYTGRLSVTPTNTAVKNRRYVTTRHDNLRSTETYWSISCSWGSWAAPSPPCRSAACFRTACRERRTGSGNLSALFPGRRAARRSWRPLHATVGGARANAERRKLRNPRRPKPLDVEEQGRTSGVFSFFFQIKRHRSRVKVALGYKCLLHDNSKLLNSK